MLSKGRWHWLQPAAQDNIANLSLAVVLRHAHYTESVSLLLLHNYTKFASSFLKMFIAGGWTLAWKCVESVDVVVNYWKSDIQLVIRTEN